MCSIGSERHVLPLASVNRGFPFCEAPINSLRYSCKRLEAVSGFVLLAVTEMSPYNVATVSCVQVSLSPTYRRFKRRLLLICKAFPRVLLKAFVMSRNAAEQYSFLSKETCLSTVPVRRSSFSLNTNWWLGMGFQFSYTSFALVSMIVWRNFESVRDKLMWVCHAPLPVSE